MTRLIQVGCIGAGGYAALLLQRLDQFIVRLGGSRPDVLSGSGGPGKTYHLTG